ncbi:hypothetical protein BHYA_0005g01250 [Botrytis hyacinthi]|uniref:Uncharacterized protein n=1 Tax=Botrytis hyacinthi TaxID=278943 RepID=A0A4Z1H5Z8_9HELO|nr:hypothetical protein BHYA_0005g01250 [Botrytis hyacinthi]
MAMVICCELNRIEFDWRTGSWYDTYNVAASLVHKRVVMAKTYLKTWAEPKRNTSVNL